MNDDTLREQISGILLTFGIEVSQQNRKNMGWRNLEPTSEILQLIAARDEQREREIKRTVLNNINQKLFFSTTQPSGQFIKDTIFAELNAIDAEELEIQRRQINPNQQTGEK